MARETKRYADVGACIYCGATDELSDEHIVPYSLEGIWLLPKSSCSKCAEVTSKLERIAGRALYGSFRNREKLRTRRKHPDQVEAAIETTEGIATIMIPQEAAIATFPIFRFTEHPGALQTPSFVGEAWVGRVELKNLTDAPRAQEQWKELPGGKISFGQAYDIDAFARLCAKIAHSFAVAEFGIDGFDPWLPSYILGRDRRLPYVVGKSHEPDLRRETATLLNWKMYEPEHGPVLVVDVQLFPVMGQPPVAVVVGGLSSAQRDRIKSRSDGREWASVSGDEGT